MSKGRLLSILAVLALVASNGFVAQARPAQHAARANASYTIALVQGISTDAFYVTMAKGVRAACAQLGLKPVIEGAPNFFDPQHQIPILTAVVAQHPDAILIAPTQKTSLVGPITAAAKAGIPIFEVDTYANDTVHLAYIASDNVLGGVTAAKAMNDLTGGKGSVAIINTDPGVSTVDQRVQGFVQGIKAYPGIKYLGLQYDHDQKALAAQETATLLRAHPDVTGIFATNELSGDGVSTAIKAAGKSGQVKLIEFDAEPGQVRDVNAGTVDALIAQHPYEIGYLGVMYAFMHLQGFDEGIKKLVQTPFTIITKANINDPKVQQAIYSF